MKIFNIAILLSLLLFLTACAPTSHVYVKNNFKEFIPKISKVLIVVESLKIKQSNRGVWIFDEEANLAIQDEIYDIASHMLQNKGYELANMSLKTSGLIVDRNFHVEHYINGEMQNHMISAPYIIRSVNFDDENIQAIESLLSQLNRPISPVMQDMRSYIDNNFRQQVSAINIDSDVAILVLQSYLPRESKFANFDIGISFASAGNSAFIDMGRPVARATSHAYLIHKATGDLLWSNKTSVINAKTQEKFFTELPIAEIK